MSAGSSSTPTETTVSRSTPGSGYSQVVMVGAVVGSLAAVLVFSEVAREVTMLTLRALLGIVTMPFILETTVAGTCLLIVLAINKHRLEKEGDGWVYMMVQEPDGKDGKPLPKAITQRLQGTVMKEKPTLLDEALAERSVVEGFLELGMAAEAQREFDTWEDLPDDAVTSALRIKVLASNLDTAKARQILATSAARFADEVPLLSATAREQADWFRKHLPSHQEQVLLWHAEAEALAGKV